MTTVSLAKLPAVRRPNGKLYRPRGLRRALVESDGGYGPLRIIVLGTHDFEVAKEYAMPVINALGRDFTFKPPRTGWWYDSIRRGEPFWAWDDVRGAAGVMFEEKG